MRSKVKHFSPTARKDGLVVEELPDEVLIYDVNRHKAHCLNQTAAIVWKHCNGRTTIPEMTEILQKDSEVPVNDDVTWLALEQLEKVHLLLEPVARPARTKGVSRRDAMRKIGFAAAVALPLVTSIVAPTPAQAATCLPPGSPCGSGAECCSGTCAVTCA
jgi:hypothetical protein